MLARWRKLGNPSLAKLYRLFEIAKGSKINPKMTFDGWSNRFFLRVPNLQATMEDALDAAKQGREVYTPRQTRANPDLPAWRRKYWEQVRKFKDQRSSRSLRALALDGVGKIG